MINLLPPIEKDALYLEQVKKLVVILAITILSFLVSLVLVLLSVYFFALGEVSLQNFSLQQATQNYQSPDSASFEALIQKYNKILPQVYSFYTNEASFSEAINSIYSVSKPEGVSFLNVSLNGAKQDAQKNEISVSITGSSDTRDNLISFQNNFLKTPLIKNVSFSPESWINSKNINFNVTFDLIEDAK